MSQLIARQAVRDLVNAYQSARQKTIKAMALMDEAKSDMKSAFGEKHLFQMDRLAPTHQKDTTLNLLLASAWKYLIDQTGVRAVMTQERTDELREQFKTGDLPPFTVQSVTDTLSYLQGDMSTMMEEMVKEVFEWLRPRKKYRERDNYKTNTEFEVGKKAILSNVFDIWAHGGSYHISVDEQNAMLTGLDNVFHLMDGQGIPRYPADLKSLIKAAVKSDKWECETEYFKCKWYKKGSFHLTFKRMDLVAKLNQIAGGARLKPAGKHRKRKRDAEET